MPTSLGQTRFTALLSAAKGGDSRSVGELFDVARPYLIAVANGLLGDDLTAKMSGADLVQDSFLDALRLLDRFDGHRPEAFRAWLVQVLRHRVDNARHRYIGAASRNVGREVPLAHVERMASSGGFMRDGGQSPSAVTMLAEQSRALALALETLPEPQQSVIRWRTWDNLPFAEIGRRLGKTEDAARMAWGRAIERLRSELGTWHR